MARKKGNQQKKGVSNDGSGLPGKTSEAIVREDEDILNTDTSVPLTESTSNKQKGEAPMKRKHKSRKSSTGVQEVVDRAQVGEQKVTVSGNCDTNESEGLHSAERDGMPQGVYGSTTSSGSTFSSFLNGLHDREDLMKHVEVSYALIVRRLKSFCLSALRASEEWMERQKPLLIAARTNIGDAFDYAKRKMEVAYPVVLKLSMHVLNVLLFLFMLWLDCTLRGVESFLFMGTTSFFSVLWCSMLCVIAVTGVFKLLLALVAIYIVGLLMGITSAILLTSISGIVLLWWYGSFWTTMLFVFLGGLTLASGRDRVALFIATSYSVYSAWASVGWLGLLFGLNLSFVSSDALIFFLRNNINERRSNNTTEQASEAPGQPDFFFDGQVPTSATNRRPGIPSTSGSDHETTSEDEVVRLLNCSDNYAALGLSRFEEIDVTVLKREYKKKAMLVHPDKNMGNEKAAEAFKKLQNAYEVLLDTSKRKAYDDELKREELLNYFRQFQGTSQRSRRRNRFFSPGHARDEAEAEDPFREIRRIACRKCGNLHVWIHTDKVKSKARWCQECGDFHSAKDGDGWVEQSSHPIIFGMLQKVDPPAAFVCADGKIYDATEWYICQGMRCPANSHKPSFHVNTSIMTAKPGTGKGTSPGQRGGVPNAPPSMEENMTKEELFEWFQNAVESGMFDNFQGGGGGAAAPETGSTSKGGASGGGGGSSTKRKKRGKK